MTPAAVIEPYEFVADRASPQLIRRLPSISRARVAHCFAFRDHWPSYSALGAPQYQDQSPPYRSPLQGLLLRSPVPEQLEQVVSSGDEMSFRINLL